MRIKLQDERVLTGTAEQIVKAMRDVAFTPRQFSTVEYIEWVVQNTSRLHGLELVVRGETDEEKAASLVDEMLKHGLASRL